jgi:hypothetical protein
LDLVDRVVPLSRGTEVGSRRRLERTNKRPVRVDAIRRYLLLCSLDVAGIAGAG